MTDANVNLVNIGGRYCRRSLGKPLLITMLVIFAACTAKPSFMISPLTTSPIATDIPSPSTIPTVLPTATLVPTSTTTPRSTSSATSTPEPNDLSAMVCDTEGNLWIGGFGGVLKFDPATEAVVAYPLDKYTNIPQVLSLIVTREETVWTLVGRYSRPFRWELFRLDGEAWDRQEDVDDQAQLWLVAAGDNGSLWVGSDIYTYYYEDKIWHKYGRNDDVPFMKAFARASDGTWWGTNYCCMMTTFFQFDGKTWTRNSPEPVLDTFVSGIATAPDGSLWFKGDAHLYHYDTDLMWTPYTTTIVGKYDWICTLTVASNSDVWIGTDEGQIQRFQDEVWYDVAQYPNRSIWALDNAPDGTVWAATSDDCIIQFDRNGATGKSYRVRQLDILPDSECLN